MFKFINSGEEFNSLLNYYISCLKKEDYLSLTFYYKSDGKTFHSNIFKKEQFFTEKKEQISIKKTLETKVIFARNKLLRRKMPLFYGYPLFMDENGKISPLFFVEIFFEEKKDSVIFTKESVKSEFNHHILNKLGYNIEEITDLRSKIKAQGDFTLQLDMVTELLGVNQKLIFSKLEQTKLILKPVSHIINKSIIYFGSGTGFTKGLIEELEELKKKSKNQLELTSLGVFFGKEKTEKGELKKELLKVFNLNISQEKVVRDSFSYGVNVVTGPPGTGKSQVVLSLISNAVWNDKTVLFASKNNRAVDVVNEKISSILSKKLIVRMGSNENRKKARLQIQKIFQNKNSLKTFINIGFNSQKIKKINEKINLIKNKIKFMSKTNEKIEEIQNKVDYLSENIPKTLYYKCKNDQFDKIDKLKLESDLIFLKQKIDLINRFIHWIFPKYHKKKIQKVFNQYARCLSKEFKSYLNGHLEESSKGIKSALEWVLIFKRVDSFKEELFHLKNNLSELKTLYKLQSEISQLQEKRLKISRKTFEAYWFKRVYEMSSKDELHVSRYLDASEKLERYIANYSLWKSLVKEQQSELNKVLSFFPIWFATNLSIKKSLPLEENIFDLLIIDEASQCDIASILPLFYRAKRVVVIGDPKQLKHISSLKMEDDQNLASVCKIPHMYLDYSYSKNSIYDIIERIVKNNHKSPVLLNQHYRSHRDIIGFSNQFFYENELNIMTNEDKLVSSKDHPCGITWVDVQGKTNKNNGIYNKVEAIKILKILKNYQKSTLKNISFGVVTLFKAQMELIVEMVKNAKELKDMDIRVGTVHQFQGDEKDLMIFSPVISDGINQTTLNWVNTTTELLNVAITRARSILIIVGDRERCKEAGGLLKKLSDSINSKKKQEIDFDSPIEKKLFNRLSKEGIKVIPQYETKTKKNKFYRLDFALFINENKYDIEIDGDKAHFHNEESDCLRDIHLRMDGWKVRRFQARMVNDNIQSVIKEIKRFS